MTPDPISLGAGYNQNFTLFCGEDKVLSIGMPGYDVAGATALEWWLAKSVFADDLTPGDVLIKKSLAAGTIGLDADGGLTITLDGTDSRDIKPELYYHELKITLAGGQTKVAMTGNAVIRMSLSMEATP
jgi:hypothetical protein